MTSRDLEIEFDAGRNGRAKIGFVLLASEQTIEDDVMRLRPRGVGVHFTRLRSPDAITSETLSAHRQQLAECAASLIPDAGLDVVCYACTSGSLVIGEDRVFTELRKGAPGARPTSLITGVIHGLRAVGARRIAVGTPYLDEINRQEKAYLEAAGFDVLDIQGLNIANDSDMVRVTPSFLKSFALSLDRPEADAVFMSCGALRTLDVVDALEAEIGKPVICSNQAMIWETLRIAGIDDRIAGYGRLLKDH